MKSNSPLRRKNSAAAAQDDSAMFFFVNRLSIHFGTETQRSRAPTPYETLGARVGEAASVPASGAVSTADGGGASVGAGGGISPAAGGAPAGTAPAGARGWTGAEAGVEAAASIWARAAPPTPSKMLAAASTPASA